MVEAPHSTQTAADHSWYADWLQGEQRASQGDRLCRRTELLMTQMCRWGSVSCMAWHSTAAADLMRRTVSRPARVPACTVAFFCWAVKYAGTCKPTQLSHCLLRLRTVHQAIMARLTEMTAFKMLASSPLAAWASRCFTT